MTTFTDISYTSTSFTDTEAGYGILCNNQTILCNSQDYYCDGSVVMRDIASDSATYTDISYS